MPPIAILVALADPTRCRIVEILRDGPKPVHQIAAAFDISRPAISRHLSVLKGARLIREKKVGRENLYAFEAARLKPVHTWLETVGKARKQQAAVAENRVKAAAPPAAIPEVATISGPVAVKPEPVAMKPAQKPTAVSQMGFDF